MNHFIWPTTQVETPQQNNLDSNWVTGILCNFCQNSRTNEDETDTDGFRNALPLIGPFVNYELGLKLNFHYDCLYLNDLNPAFNRDKYDESNCPLTPH